MTAPSSYAKNTWVPPLVVTCGSSGSTLACIATFSNDGVVTTRASWTAAESSLLASGPQPTASEAVVFQSPGVPMAISARNVYIRADYTSSRYGHVSNTAIHAYTLAPGADPVPLSRIGGTVYEGTPGPGVPVVPNAVVEIITGEGSGKRATTLGNGAYSFEFLRMGQPFTIRASKAGYSTDTKEHPGIVDDALGQPSNTGIPFSIQPVR